MYVLSFKASSKALSSRSFAQTYLGAMETRSNFELYDKTDQKGIIQINTNVVIIPSITNDISRGSFDRFVS